MNDTNLWNQYCKTGLEKDFEQFYQALNGYAYTIAHAYLKEEEESLDALHSGWLRFLQENAGRTSKDIKPVLGRTIAREADRLRKKRSRHQKREVKVEAEVLQQHQGGDASDAVMTNEQADLVRNSISELPERLRIPVELFYFHGLKQKEIASVLDRPQGTISSQIADALKKLEPKFKKLGLSTPSILLGGLAGGGMLLTPPASAMTAGQVFQQSAGAGGLAASTGFLGTVTGKVTITGVILTLAIIVYTGIQLSSSLSGGFFKGDSGADSVDISQMGDQPGGDNANSSDEGINRSGRDGQSSNNQGNNTTANQRVAATPTPIVRLKKGKKDIKLVVKDLAGDPLSSVKVNLTPLTKEWANPDFYEQSIYTNEQGIASFQKDVVYGERFYYQIEESGYHEYVDWVSYFSGGDGDSPLTHDVTLRQLKSASGTVYSSEGIALQNVHVRAYGRINPEKEYQQPTDYSEETYTDELGRFTLYKVPEELNYQVAFMHPEHRWELVEKTDLKEMVVKLEGEPKYLTGKVYTPTGESTKDYDVILSLTDPENPALQMNTVAEGGHFEFGGLKEGDYHVRVKPVDPDPLGVYWQQGSNTAQLSPGDLEKHLDIYTGGPTELKLRLVNADTGKAIPNLQVIMNHNMRDEGEPVDFKAVSDENGYLEERVIVFAGSQWGGWPYPFSDSFSVSLNLESKESGFLFSHSPYNSNQTNISFNSSSISPYIEVPLEEAFFISGTIYTPTDSRAPEGIRVYAGNSSTLTSDYGTYDLAIRRPSNQMVLKVISDAGSYQETLRIPEEKNAIVKNIRLEPGVTLKGTVKDEEGNPVANALLTADAGGSLLNERTSDDGSYQFSNLPKNTYEIKPFPSNTNWLRPYILSDFSISLLGEETVVERDIVLQKGWILEGVVSDINGAPLEGVRVWSDSSKSFTTDKFGAYRIEGIEENASIDVEYMKDGYETLSLKDISVIDGNQNVVLQREAMSGTQITLLNSSNRPIPFDLSVFVYEEKWEQIHSIDRSSLDSAFVDFKPGKKYRLIAVERDLSITSPANYAIHDIEYFDPEDNHIELQTKLTDPLKLQIVSEETLGPLDDRQIFLHRVLPDHQYIHESSLPPQRTDSDGRVTFAAAIPGEYAVSLYRYPTQNPSAPRVQHPGTSATIHTVKMKQSEIESQTTELSLKVLFPENLKDDSLIYRYYGSSTRAEEGKVVDGETIQLEINTGGGAEVTLINPSSNYIVSKAGFRCPDSENGCQMIWDLNAYRQYTLRVKNPGFNKRYLKLWFEGERASDIVSHRLDHEGSINFFARKGRYNLYVRGEDGLGSYSLDLQFSDEKDLEVIFPAVDLDLVMVYPDSSTEQGGNIIVDFEGRRYQVDADPRKAMKELQLTKPYRRLSGYPIGNYKFTYISDDGEWVGETDWIDLHDPGEHTVTIDLKRVSAGVGN